MYNVRHALENAQELGQSYLNSSTSRPARLEALVAAKKLVRELETGEDAMFNRLGDFASTMALNFMIHLGVPRKIPKEGSISLEDLATAVNAEPSFLVRFLRLLCSIDFFKEVSQNTYAHTKHSELYADDITGDIQLCIMNEQWLPVFSRLSEYFADRPLTNPDDPLHQPICWAHNMDGSNWIEVLARKPENMAVFAKMMGSAWDFAPAVGIYPFGEELKAASDQAMAEDKPFMVDIGSSAGDTMKTIRQHFPELKGKMIVQDIPQVIHHIPAGHLPPGIEPQVHDFWTPQPIKGAPVYYLRRILHDWPDRYCQQILSHVADAMDEMSKVLVAETIIPERVEVHDSLVYVMDLAMFTFAGKERTAQAWKDLFEASGLEIVKIWRSDVKAQAVLEGRKKRV